VAYDKDKKGGQKGSSRTVGAVATTTHHAMFEHDGKEGEDRITAAKKHLFMLNNLFNVAVHLRGRISSLSDSGGKVYMFID
jgi:hypothetical protein